MFSDVYVRKCCSVLSASLCLLLPSAPLLLHSPVLVAVGSVVELGGLVQFSSRHPVYLAWHSSSAPRTGEPATLPSLILTHVRPVSANDIWNMCVGRGCLHGAWSSTHTCMGTLSVSMWCLTYHHYRHQIFVSVHYGLYRHVGTWWAAAGSHYTWRQIAFASHPPHDEFQLWKRNQSGGLAGLSCLTTLWVYLPFTSHYTADFRLGTVAILDRWVATVHRGL